MNQCLKAASKKPRWRPTTAQLLSRKHYNSNIIIPWVWKLRPWGLEAPRGLGNLGFLPRYKQRDSREAGKYKWHRVPVAKQRREGASMTGEREQSQLEAANVLQIQNLICDICVAVNSPISISATKEEGKEWRKNKIVNRRRRSLFFPRRWTKNSFDLVEWNLNSCNIFYFTSWMIKNGQTRPLSEGSED